MRADRYSYDWPMGRVALLTNPESGSGEAASVEQELRALGADLSLHPIQKPESALEDEPERIVVAGGDGSVGPAAAVASRARIPLAVVPVGTANDFARALGIPDDPAAACRIAAGGTRTRRIELGRMDERPFVNVASLGLPPAAAQRSGGLKRWLGALSYTVGAIRAGLTARPVTCRVADGDAGELYSGPAWQATLACSGAFGGGSQVDADPADGLLDAVVVAAGSRVRLVALAYGLRAGGLARQRGVHSRRAASFEVEVGPRTPFNVDGELCTRSGLVEFTIDPHPVDVVVG